MESIFIQPSYQTLGEICQRLNCGPDRVKTLIRQEGLPAVRIAGQYMMTEKQYLKWLGSKAENISQGQQ